MIFRDREDAGRQLAARLAKYANRDDVIVLGIPRGGVPVAFQISTGLHAPLDIFLSRKLGVPGQEEFAFGAIAAGDGRFLDQHTIQAVGLSKEEVDRITAATAAVLDQRAHLYRDGRAPLPVEGRVVILVDDGIATGASIYAAICALRQMKPRQIILAVPVAPASACRWLASIVDEMVVIHKAYHFYAVGQYYYRFSQVLDDEVIRLLHEADKRSIPVQEMHGDCPGDQDPPLPGFDRRDVSVPLDNKALQGTLTVPKDPKGVVLFVHGSGSSRHSPRNQYVAGVIQKNGLATLLFDLLSSQEEAVDRQTAQFRFNIPLLSERLLIATRWIMQYPITKGLPIGYFGASTGAAAALVAAARMPDSVAAIVSRGGRPDLAKDALESVAAPTLFIVGGRDEVVINLNRQTLAQMSCRAKQLIVVPEATHLFEEAGALEQVAQAATEWLARYLSQSGHTETNGLDALTGTHN